MKLYLWRRRPRSRGRAVADRAARGDANAETGADQASS